MNTAAIPQIDRNMPRGARIVVSLVFYGLALPLNWVFTRLGVGSLMILIMRRMRRKNRWPKVFEGYDPTPHPVNCP